MNAEEFIWSFLKAQGFTDAGAAGLMGNLYAESGLRPNNLQNSYEGKLGMADAEYTEMVDRGTYTNFGNDRAGYGLAQWTYPSRKAALLAYAKAAGKSIGDLEMQLGFLMKELSAGYKAVLNVLKTATGVRAASDAVLLQFERPADQSESVKARRASYGQKYFDKYAAKTAATGGTKMNKKPVSYLQTDSRWKNKPYRVKGENATIGGSGCGPTAAAMLIETITGKKFTPEDACNWSMAHGYKALGNGTYYGYFKPQFAEFGIDCDMLNWTKTYGKPDHANHKKVEEMLKQGYYFIALMLEGLWTSGGHFVVLWWQDSKMRILDPASTREVRLNGDIRTFRSQCAYYWWIDARKFNGNGTAVKPPVASGGTPATGSAPSLGLKVGDIVNFTGTQHYYSANATKPSACRPGQAKVTQIYNGKHPYQLVNVKGGGSTVYGWVDEKDIQPPALAAVDKLAKLGIINSPDYWKQAVASGKVKYLDILLTKAAAKISRAGTRTSTPEAGVAALVAAGVIDTPDYWLSNYGTFPSLGALLCALGGAVK